jgi:[histone H3]-lysine36 N-dimethyltransferase SETMAR
MESAIQHQRDIIFFLWKEGVPGAQIEERLTGVFGEAALGKRAVYQWIQRFKDGRTTTDDDDRSGRPCSSATAENIQAVEELILQDRRITVKEIADMRGISVGTVSGIIKDLRFSKVCARWIPKLLSDPQKQERLNISKKNLKMIVADKNKFFARLITVDETWIHHQEVETKMQSQQWCRSGENPPLKAIRVPSAGKVLMTVFFDENGVIYSDYLMQGATINSKYYSDLLQGPHRKALWKKRPGKTQKIPLILQDNARPHTAKLTLDTIANLGWEILPHPPYSPDLSPCDFFLFPKMKNSIRGRHFTSTDEIKNHFRHWFSAQEETFYSDGIRALQHRYEKCVLLHGSYIKKCSIESE